MDKKVENCYKDNSEKDVYVELLQWNCIYLYHIVVSTRNCFARILQNICSEVFMNRKNNENNKSDSIGNSNIPVKQDIPDLFHIEEYKMLREEFIVYMDKLQMVRNMVYVAVVARYSICI